MHFYQLISQSVKWWKLNNYNIFSNKEKQEVEFSSLKLVHSPKGLQMFSVDDVGDFWNTAAEDQTVLQPEVSINYSFLFYFFFFKNEDSPKPTPSNCARSRSMVCLITASLAPWRRPCRPLIPFMSSICSSSESNLWRYLKTENILLFIHFVASFYFRIHIQVFHEFKTLSLGEKYNLCIKSMFTVFNLLLHEICSSLWCAGYQCPGKILTDCDSFLAHQCSRFITGSGVLLVHVQGL